MLRDASNVPDDSGEPNPTNPFSSGKLRAGAVGQPDSKYVTSRAGLGKLMYQQLSNEQNIFLSFYELGEAFGRIIRGRANLVWEGTFLCTVGLIYGGVHLATWNNFFVTELERNAWKTCSIITSVAVSGFVLELCVGALIKLIKFINFGEAAEEDEDQSIPDVEKSTYGTAAFKQPTVDRQVVSKKVPQNTWYRLIWRVYKFVVGSTFTFGLIIVICARLFLLLESFISLRVQPDGAYDTVDWVESIPHLG